MATGQRGKTERRVCACGVVYYPRTADLKRGWGRSCSKSCAATRSNKKTGKYRRYLAGQGVFNDNTAYHAEDPSWDAHKDSF